MKIELFLPLCFNSLIHKEVFTDWFIRNFYFILLIAGVIVVSFMEDSPHHGRFHQILLATGVGIIFLGIVMKIMKSDSSE